MSGLSRANIKRLLHKLSSKLAEKNIVGELYLVGGAVMCLAFDARASTKDLGGYFVPKELVRAAAQQLGEEENLDNDWLNDGVKGFLSEKGTFETYIELPNLRVFIATPEYLLAMKCLSMRIGREFQDEADVRFLLRYLNIEKLNQALEIIGLYYPPDKFPAKTRFALEEILGADSK